MPKNPDHILLPGVYAPILTSFKGGSSDEVDLAAFSRSVGRLARAGVGIIVGGPYMLGREERNALTRSAKDTLQKMRFERQIPIIVGVMGSDVRECVALAKDVAECGADAMYS